MSLWQKTFLFVWRVHGTWCGLWRKRYRAESGTILDLAGKKLKTSAHSMPLRSWSTLTISALRDNWQSKRGRPSRVWAGTGRTLLVFGGKKKRKLKTLGAKISLTGNWTRVARVTGGNTHHYTIRESFRFFGPMENFRNLVPVFWQCMSLILTNLQQLSVHSRSKQCFMSWWTIFCD